VRHFHIVNNEFEVELVDQLEEGDGNGVGALMILYQRLLRLASSPSFIHSDMSIPSLDPSARMTASSQPLSSPSQTHDKSVASVINSQPLSQHLSLNDLPAEIIHIIAQYVRLKRKRRTPVCRCAHERSHSFDLSTAPAEKYSDPSWALSCASKRYREIVFHGNRSRSFGFCFEMCCLDKVAAIPKEIRASVT
jgi:hypothetical protein